MLPVILIAGFLVGVSTPSYQEFARIPMAMLVSEISYVGLHDWQARFRLCPGTSQICAV